jgi:magnesium-protoporphyrin O-methyltransferase
LTSCHCGAGACYDAKFDDRRAKADLQHYHKKGPNRSTHLLLDALRAQGVEGASLLDIGGGVGVVQHELLRAGAARATQVDASRPYLTVAEGEAARRGNADRATFALGDFVDVAPTVGDADLVTLDRVICCYGDMESLVAASSRKARRLYGIVVPRDRWWVRAGEQLGNLIRRLRRDPFRSFVHPVDAIDAAVRRQGFVPVSSAHTFVWQILVYAR